MIEKDKCICRSQGRDSLKNKEIAVLRENMEIYGKYKKENIFLES